MIGNNRSGSLPARDGGVGKRENAADGEQKDEQQVGTEVKRGTTQPELEQVVAPQTYNDTYRYTRMLETRNLLYGVRTDINVPILCHKITGTAELWLLTRRNSVLLT